MICHFLKFPVLLALTAAWGSVGAQSLLWSARFDFKASNDEPRGLAVDPSGSTYVTGFSDDGSGRNVSTVKYGSDGARLWVRSFPGMGNLDDAGNAVAVAPDGGVIVAGETTRERTGRDFLILKYDSSGNLLWARRYDGAAHGDDRASLLAIDPGGSIYVGGFSTDTESGTDYVLVKLGADGSRLWARRWSGPGSGNDYPSGLALATNGDLILTGTSWTSVGEDLMTLRVDSNGSLVWRRRFAGAAAYGRSLALDSEDSAVVVGIFYALGGADAQMLALKYGADGSHQWTRWVAGSAGLGDQGTAVAIDSQDNVFMAGSTYSIDGRNDFTIAKYTKAGAKLWTKVFDSAGHFDDLALDVVVDASGSVYVTGGSDGDGTGPLGFGMLTVKLNPLGQTEWSRRFDDSGNDFDTGVRIALVPAGGVVVAGYTRGAATGGDFRTFRYGG